ncbi:MAG: hypothetical protein BWY55_00561 [archaeon ADurb.Bin336]|nr:MAG: hypothetical protein BWY55_00561 [archaeon ADurb.Bin336]
MNNKGFLFTISIIFFASTLVFFTQGFYDANVLMERKIISSQNALNVNQLNEDLAFDLGNLFGLRFDVNSIEGSVLIEGKISSSSNEISSLNDWNSFLNNNYFNRSFYNKSIDLSNLVDGKAEFFLGDNLNMDYNYGNSIALFSSKPIVIESIDLNIKSSGSLVSYNWVKSSGENNFGVSIIYSNDYNRISITDSISNNSYSYLELIYPDGVEVIEFGGVNYNGVNYNSAFVLNTISNKVIDYKVKVDYVDVYLYPIKINSILRVNSDRFNSNSFLKLYK